MSDTLAVGLVGAGPWALLAHAPMLNAGPETRLAGVWARRTEAAAEVLRQHGCPVFESYERLLDVCDAVAFAVPPDVQVPLAIQAAQRGKAVLLEKPVALTLDDARRLADAVGEAGVGSLVFLSYRFAPAVQAFIGAAQDLDPDGGRAAFVSNSLLEGLFAGSPWRQEHGALFDLGPHAIDLVDVALGPVVDAQARRSYDGAWIGLLLGHEGGAVSEVSLSAHVGIEAGHFTAEAFGRSGVTSVDAMRSVNDGWSVMTGNLRATFAHQARHPGPHDLDVHRGLHLQEVLTKASASLRR
jgi:predicted dehydrogenase